MAEPFRLDKLEEKVRMMRADIKSNLSPDFLEMIDKIGLEKAEEEAKRINLREISDEFRYTQAFSRLQRLKTNSVLFDVYSQIQVLNVKGYDCQKIRSELTEEKIKRILALNDSFN